MIIAPEYRRSTGYGGDFYEHIDYGGAEIDDVKAAREWAVETVTGVDPKRVAGVPVSDLVQRRG